MNKKIIASILAALIIAAPVLGSSTLVSAAEATQQSQTVNARTVSRQAQKLVDKATGELGYKEKGNNETKYGDWYGLPGQPWCAMFVSWCSNKAGIPTSIIPKFASCSVGIEWFQKHHRWYVHNYTPKVGDLIFFNRGHVGIVTSFEDGVVNTIEGNSADMVRRRRYRLPDDRIKGYATPDWDK